MAGDWPDRRGGDLLQNLIRRTEFRQPERRLFKETIQYSTQVEACIDRNCMFYADRRYKNKAICSLCQERFDNTHDYSKPLSLKRMCEIVLMMNNLVVCYMELNYLPPTIVGEMETEAIRWMCDYFPTSCLPLLQERIIPNINIFQLFELTKNLTTRGTKFDDCGTVNYSRYLFNRNYYDDCRQCRINKKVLNKKLQELNFLPFRVARWWHCGKFLENVTLQLRANFFKFGTTINRDNGKIISVTEIPRRGGIRMVTNILEASSSYVPPPDPPNRTAHSASLFIYPVLSDRHFYDQVQYHYSSDDLYPELLHPTRSVPEMIEMFRQNMIWPFDSGVFEQNGLWVREPSVVIDQVLSQDD